MRVIVGNSLKNAKYRFLFWEGDSVGTYTTVTFYRCIGTEDWICVGKTDLVSKLNFITGQKKDKKSVINVRGLMRDRH